MTYCTHCKILFSNNDIKLKFGINYFHSQCLVIHLQSDLIPKTKRMTSEQAVNYVNSLIEVLNQKELEKKQQAEEKAFEKAQKKIAIAQSLNDKQIPQQKLLEYFKINYKLTMIDKFLIDKLEQINNGTYKDLTTPISYDLLRNIFSCYQKSFDAIAYYKHQNGKGFANYRARLNYDIAVAISKVDEYKEKQAERELILEQQRLTREETIQKVDGIQDTALKAKQYQNTPNKKDIMNNSSGVNIDNAMKELLKNEDE